MKTELFKNALQTGGIWKCRLCGLVWTGNILKRWPNDNRAIFLPEVSSNTNVIVAFSNFSGLVWTENIWCVFRVKMPFSNFFKHKCDCCVFKFLRPIVDGTSVKLIWMLGTNEVAIVVVIGTRPCNTPSFWATANQFNLFPTASIHHV